MQSSLALILAEEISEAAEAVINDATKRKMTLGCSMAVRIMRAIEARYGPEAKQVAHKAFTGRNPRPTDQLGPPEEDLRDYLQNLEKACAGTHEWERVTDETDRVEYRFTRCAWAEIFNELGAADIGSWICEGDDLAVNNYNPRLRCRLTRTLMNKDPYCNHCFYVQAREGLGEHSV